MAVGKHQVRPVDCDGWMATLRVLRVGCDDPNNRTWCARWNNDNEPHLEINWVVNAIQEAGIDP